LVALRALIALLWSDEDCSIACKKGTQDAGQKFHGRDERLLILMGPNKTNRSDYSILGCANNPAEPADNRSKELELETPVLREFDHGFTTKSNTHAASPPASR
jgi:hypothetical protein